LEFTRGRQTAKPAVDRRVQRRVSPQHKLLPEHRPIASVTRGRGQACGGIGDDGPADEKAERYCKKPCVAAAEVLTKCTDGDAGEERHSEHKQPFAKRPGAR